ncbi:hypothetical protein PINS_up022695 [Pythium insidiosum]|nr:hypothetical protein PINS_up022695 [Pythium insidiosum]
MGNVQQYIGKRVEVAQYQVEVTKYLGEGGSSFIFLVRDVQRESAKPMVLKRLLAESDAAFQWIQREIDMHQRFRHASVVEFFASHVNRKNRSEREVYILMEYCPSGHLYDNMTKMGEKRFSEKELLQLFRSLCVCVLRLSVHSKGTTNFSIDVVSVALSTSCIRRILPSRTAISSSRTFSWRKTARTSCATLARASSVRRVCARKRTAHARPSTCSSARPRCTARPSSRTSRAPPCLARASSRRPWMSGPWACVLYTMAFFKPPFPPDGLRTERYTIPKESKYSPDVHQLIARMLQADVERRATIAHVIECIDELLAGRPLPKSAGAGATSSPRKTAPPAATTSASTHSTKTTEARKESVAAPKPSAASDLLDMDFNPTISMPPAASAAPQKAVDPFNAAWGATTAAPAAPTDGFADFANFPSSPRAFGAATAPAPAPSSFDAFGFPLESCQERGRRGLWDAARSTKRRIRIRIAWCCAPAVVCISPAASSRASGSV